MPALKKATLQEISGDSRRSPVGSPVDVQFNPTTLHLQLSNQIEGGETRGRTARQFVGANAATLTLDLVFDTADEGTTERPVSVRTKTAIVERYVLPQQTGAETPPKLRFQWAELVIEGIVDSVGIDFDHFAADGTPLRAKVSLSIREQDPRYQYLQAGPGARGGGGLGAGIGFGASVGIGASIGLGASIGIGGSFEAGASFGAGFSGGLSGQATFALEGESAVELATRLGLDPGAWRGLDVDLSGGVGLAAGTEVGFDARLAAGPGLGASAGFEAESNASLESSFGLEDAGASGFALSAAGGVSAAVAAVQSARADEAADAARSAFQDPGAADRTSAAAARPAPPAQSRTPMRIDGVPTPARQAASAPAPPPPTVDPRAVTYGSGVPLRPRRRGTVEDRSSLSSTQTKGGHSHSGGCSCGCGGRGGRR